MSISSPDSDLDHDVAPTTAEHPVMEQLARAGRSTRWHMSRRTLEVAIRAIEAPLPADAAPRQPTGPGKSRRRRRHKRLL
jgi:hypothetical protein